MNKITVVGIDPSLNNFGLVRGYLDMVSGAFEIEQISLSEAPAPKMKMVRKNSQDLARAQVQHDSLQNIIRGADIAMVEIPVGSQSARSMASYGICIGVLASVKSVPLIQVTPAEVKLAATNSKTASKQDMIDWAIGLYPNANWLTRTVKGETTYVSKNEHIADAIAAVHAGVKTDEFKQFRAAYNQLRNK